MNYLITFIQEVRVILKQCFVRCVRQRLCSQRVHGCCPVLSCAPLRHLLRCHPVGPQDGGSILASFTVTWAERLKEALTLHESGGLLKSQILALCIVLSSE